MYCSKLSLSVYLFGHYSSASHWLCGILNSCLTCSPCWATWVAKMIMRMTAVMMEMITMIVSALVYLYFSTYICICQWWKKTNLGDCGSVRPLPLHLKVVFLYLRISISFSSNVCISVNGRKTTNLGDCGSDRPATTTSFEGCGKYFHSHNIHSTINIIILIVDIIIIITYFIIITY